MFNNYGFMRIVIFILLNFATDVVAQTRRAGEKQLSFNIGAENYGAVVFKYYANDRYCHRYGVVGSYNSSVIYYGVEPGTQFDYKTYSYNFGLSYGIQRSFGASERIDPYFGVDLVGRTSYSKEYLKQTIIDETITRSGKNGDYSTNTSIDPNNLGMILRPVFGLSFLISKRFSIGAEYQIPLLYLVYSEGGQTTYFAHHQSGQDYSNTYHFKKGTSFRSIMKGNGFFTFTYSF
jgi:hypothetical protein